ncbi:shikimate dehydrogenase [Lysinibacillus agricola]|uniref:Shikimate dehydrogenase (NADP(+)) n=1 Tax=Lysinibacillus agricola TaxID=2590012 RepID=A0ABX7ATI7_9BACI|nr:MULTISPECIES: shikimate dehydrogenase [Lysinibacillus]QQP12500.1 shikimate dehydrogenase [Lysinibacillus agricola]
MVFIQVYGILGNPLVHSLSPLLQNETYKENNIQATFQKFEVADDGLTNIMMQLKSSRVGGLLVTIPYKEKVLPYIDELDITAKNTGVVNIIQALNGKLIGYNFDGQAWLAGLLQEFNLSNLNGMKILLIGFGGVAKSIYFELLQFEDVEIDITNRTVDKVKNSIDRPNIKILSYEEAEQQTLKYDVIIQTTPIGMWPHTDAMPLNIVQLKEKAIVSDVIYNPKNTAFLKQAKNLGARIQNGMTMLVMQNHKAIKMWFQKDVNYSQMVNLINK